MDSQLNVPQNNQSSFVQEKPHLTHYNPDITLTKIAEKFNQEEALKRHGKETLSASQLTSQRQRLTFPGLFAQVEQDELQKIQLNSNIKQSCNRNEDFEKSRNIFNKSKDSQHPFAAQKKTQKIIRKVETNFSSLQKQQQLYRRGNRLHNNSNQGNYLKIESHIQDLLDYSDVKPIGQINDQSSKSEFQQIREQMFPDQNPITLRLIPTQLSHIGMPNHIQQKIKAQTANLKVTPYAVREKQNLKNSHNQFFEDPINRFRDAVPAEWSCMKLQSSKLGFEQSGQNSDGSKNKEGMQMGKAVRKIQKRKIQEYEKYQVNNKKSPYKQKWIQPSYSQKECSLNKVQSMDRTKFKEEHKRTSTEAITSCNDRIYSQPDRRKNQTVYIQDSVPQEDSVKENSRNRSRVPIQQHIMEKFKDIELALKHLKQNSRSTQNLLGRQQFRRGAEGAQSRERSIQSRQSDMEKMLTKVQNIANGAPKVENHNSKNHRINRDQVRRGKIEGVKSDFWINKQLMDLKQKLLQIQQETNFKRPYKSPKKTEKAIYIQEDYSIQRKKKQNCLTVNYREYLPSANGRVDNNKRFKDNGKLSKIYEQNEQLFSVRAIQAPDLFDCPNISDSKGQLKQKGIDALQSFEVGSKMYSQMDILKFDNRVQYYLPQVDVFVYWEYTGKFYIGESKISKTKQMRYKQGKGIQMMPDEYVYKGSFKNNVKNGQGIINYCGGNKYQGQWKNDKFHGKGKLISDESKYDGQFYKGQNSGCGKQYFQNKDVYVGQYEEGKFQGIGRYIWRNQTEYMGYFKKGYMWGLGEWVSYNGDSYKGQYFRNLKHGQGIYRWKNGMIFKGTFINGQKQNLGPIKVRNTIPVEKQISCDLLNSDDQSRENEMVQREKQCQHQFIFKSFGNSPNERRDQKKHVNYGQLL